CSGSVPGSHLIYFCKSPKSLPWERAPAFSPLLESAPRCSLKSKGTHMFQCKLPIVMCMQLLLLACASSMQTMAQTTAATAAALAGRWEIPLPVHGAASIYSMPIEVKGDTFTGAIANFPIAEGKINGGEITFKLM